MTMNTDAMHDDPLERHLGYWMRLVSNQVSGAFAHSLSQYDLSTAEWVALNRIERTQDLTSSTLSASMSMTRGAVSKILDKLESKALIKRSASRDDNRVQFLSLTRDGRRLLPVLTEVANGNDDRFFSVLDESERTALRLALQKLADIHAFRNVPIE
ncbi:MarR family winged helix-turn-helix transcriptional regulator [Cupriavidus sp. 30B13]|uniref:MarR family winged helix-turn-helix transcriptional regulator n=1 Tax=Cupriavidus sp. 30B13 TaxID=3384241 RepID=UPI003B91BD24